MFKGRESQAGAARSHGTKRDLEASGLSEDQTQLVAMKPRDLRFIEHFEAASPDEGHVVKVRSRQVDPYAHGRD